MPSKTKKKSVSMFGINDCHKPKQNNKKNYTFKNKYHGKSLKLKSRPYNYKNVVLFPHNLGQTKTGVVKAPKYIDKFINHRKHTVSLIKNTGNLFQNLRDLYNVNKKLKGKRVNIGGDHSMAIATIAHTMNTYPNAKVVYFDAHADLNTLKHSKSKHYHGMPLSFATGLDKDAKFEFIKHKLDFNNLLYIGGRCWDIFERDQIYSKNIKFLSPDDINHHFEESLNKILQFVGNSAVHVSFDVDSIDPKYIPSTGTAVKNGIELQKAITILDQLNSKNLVNLDITELNMDLGDKSSDGIKSGKNTRILFKKFLKG